MHIWRLKLTAALEFLGIKHDFRQAFGGGDGARPPTGKKQSHAYFLIARVDDPYVM